MSPYFHALRSKLGNALLLVPSVAAVIRDEQGRVLLQEKRFNEGWSLPAGAIEPGETPQATLVREVREETGLDVVPSSVIGVFGGAGFRYVYPNRDTVEYTVIVFKCVVVGGRIGAVDNETKSLRYFTRSEMPQLALPYPVDTFFSA